LRKPLERLSAAVVVALALVFVPHATPTDSVEAASPTALPFSVKVLTENDEGLGAMKYADMAKLVYMMFASGAPAGSYNAAREAGMKTVWYQDPHRIGDVPGHMSDRPPVTDLRKDADLMKCARGGLLDATYAPDNGTYFGDPSSPELLRQTNVQLAKATAHYGPISYAWLDDSMLLTDEWAEAWYCGSAAPALVKNGGNGMPLLGHGVPRAADIAYADGTRFTPANFLERLVAFDNGVRVPVLDEGACVGDGSAFGGTSEDAGATATLVATAKNSAGALCENFAEGWGNRQTLNGKAVDGFWKSDLNSGIQVISARKLFINYQYIGDEGASNRGTPDDYDQRGFIYASFMLIFDHAYSVYKTGLSGARLGVKAPVLVFPETLLVPAKPLETAVWPQRIDVLKHGGVYVREFADCGFAGQSIGPCAAVVNPSSSGSVPLPALRQSYRHAIAFVGNDGAFTGRHGTPNYGDSGDVDFGSRPVPASLGPAGWAILVAR
jgi:hypothetical protein